MKPKNKIPAFQYLSGTPFVDKLKEVLDCRSHQELSDILDIPKSTFSTWSKFDRTSHEVIVRLHLALGTPLEDLALKPEDRKSDFDDLEITPALAGAMFNSIRAEEEAGLRQLNTVVIDSFCLTNGQLIDTGKIPYPIRRINSFGLDSAKVIEVETNEAIYLLDKSTLDAVAGRYLIDVDGRLSINHIQRLPGKKLAIAFGDSTIEVSEHDIKVVGRVAVTLKKD